MAEDRSNVADYEEVLKVLSESLQENWKDNPDVLVYLSELGSLGLHRLTQEPGRLSEEKVLLLEQTQDLAFHNYKTFIQAAECSQKIFQDFNIIESRLDSLVSKLPIFKQKCGDFGKEAQQINTRWKQASLTLAKHQQLLEFLEMPQLMDNYVKAGYYDEALELSAYVKRLERKHVDIPLIKSIVNDVQASVNSMLNQLLSKLQTNIQLPECLKIVGYLRRMDAFNETELRIKFLHARDTWFKKVINDIEENDRYQHVIKVIESSRIHLFDIITQYRAIFSDDDPLLLVGDNSKSNCAIFHSWITLKISWFLQTLEKDIAFNLGGRIDSVFAQCMYFGLSFSRVNIDFRPLLIPVFQNAVFNRFQAEVESATHKFSKTMVMYVFSSYTNTALLVPSFSEDSLQPPNSLLDFHPLAQYCNDILNALNELKLCCSFSMASDVTKSLTESLDTLVKVLVGVFYQKKNMMNDQAKEHFYKFCLSLYSELVPHLNKCIFILFPPEQISQVLGISSMEFKKFEHSFKLNSQAIMKPLEDVLPVTKEDDDDQGLILNIKSEMQETEQASSSVEDSVLSAADESSELSITPSQEISSGTDLIVDKISLSEELSTVLTDETNGKPSKTSLHIETSEKTSGSSSEKTVPQIVSDEIIIETKENSTETLGTEVKTENTKCIRIVEDDFSTKDELGTSVK